jgi:3-hydroxy-9,10-secoandrosta-1,3,5(10)-triene-9,17-dione monooxygenase
MSAKTAFRWTPSKTLPEQPQSLVGVGYGEMLERARSLLPGFAERAAECERQGRLLDDNERDLHRTGLFRALQPARVGGPELDLGIIVEVCAEIAKVCPSTSWNFGNLASHHWMLAYYEPETQDEIWSVSPDTLIATSLAFPAGRGRKIDGGWEVSGRWPLSSGVDNSDWNMLGFMVRESETGPPVDQRFALIHRSQYQIIDNWQAVGLAGTGSKDVAASKVFVPDRRSVSAWAMNGKPHAGSKVNPGPLFRLPLLALGPYVLTGVMLGCAKGAYEQAVGGARKRLATSTGVPVNASQAVQLKVAEASARIDTAEMLMKAACAHAMEKARAGQEFSHDDKVRYRRDAFFATRMCLEAVDLMMGLAGSSAIYLTSSVQRLFRDAHAANAHVMFSPELQGTIFGQHALGVQAPPPLM